MKKSHVGPTGRSRLRRQAEQVVDEREAASPTPPPPDGDQWRRLAYELHVHEVELETQNEELRTARLELEAGLERYSALFDFAPIGYAMLAPDETIREINHAGARLLGLDRSRLTGKPFGNFLSLDDRPTLGLLLGRAVASGVRETCEVNLRIPPSGYLRLAATSLAKPDHRVLLAFEDITDAKQREKRLVQTERALREADHHKDEFLSLLSHELRNPLAPIMSSLALLDQADHEGEPAQRARAVIRRQVQHLTRLIDDLLDVTRISRGKVRLNLGVVDLGELVRHTLNDQQAVLEARHLVVRSELDPSPCWVNVDSTRIVQAFTNVLGNAAKFTPPGGQVRVELRREGTKAALVVSDTGAGVAPEMIGRVFQPFVQAPQTLDRSGGGLGLGLPMTKGMLELHGGTVAIASAGVNQGTRVTLTLPLVAAPAHALEAAAPKERPASVQRRVLVIDDNVDAADSLKDGLAILGHEVWVAYDGPTGVESARRRHPEVVLCDIGLPGMTGYEVASVLRSESSLNGVLLLALTGYGSAEDRELALAMGFDRHITKPVDLDVLVRLISQAPAQSLPSTV